MIVIDLGVGGDKNALAFWQGLSHGEKSRGRIFGFGKAAQSVCNCHPTSLTDSPIKRVKNSDGLADPARRAGPGGGSQFRPMSGIE
jgi:hypothetical protein